MAFAEHLHSTRRVRRFCTKGQRHHKKNNSKYTFSCITTNDWLIFDSEHLSKFQYRIYVCIYNILCIHIILKRERERERCDVVIIHRLLIQAPYLSHIRREKSHHPHVYRKVTSGSGKSHQGRRITMAQPVSPVMRKMTDILLKRFIFVKNLARSPRRTQNVRSGTRVPNAGVFLMALWIPEASESFFCALQKGSTLGLTTF